VFKDYITVQNWNCDAKLLRKWLLGTGESIEFLESIGMHYDLAVTETADPSKFRNSRHIPAKVERKKNRSQNDDMRNIRCEPYRCRKNVWTNTARNQCEIKKIAITMSSHPLESIRRRVILGVELVRCRHRAAKE